MLIPPSGKATDFILGYNETVIILSELEDNKKYTYSVTAINNIGNATTGAEKYLSEFNL